MTTATSTHHQAPPVSEVTHDTSPHPPDKEIDEETPPEYSIDSKTNLRRPNRPPDLKISSSTDDTAQVEGTVVEAVSASEDDLVNGVLVQRHSSTPSKLSGNESYSFASESMIKNISSEYTIYLCVFVCSTLSVLFLRV